jgi:flagellar basal body rod protein FlgC
MIDFQTPLTGLERASASLDRTAARIAAAPFPAGDTVDLAAETIALLQARNDFAANVKVVQTFDQLSRSLLNIVG